MYSKKNQGKKIFYTKTINDSPKMNNLKTIQTEENKNTDYFLNNEYFKDFYCSKKKKKNFVSYYSKKKFRSIILDNDKIQLSDYIIHPEPFYSNLSNFDKVKRNVSYTIRNPQKEKSKNKESKTLDYNISKNTLNNETEEEINNLNLNSNNSNTIYTDFLNESNKNTFLNRSNRSYRIRGNIDLSRYQDHDFSSKKKQKIKENLPQSSSNTSKRVSFVIDYSKDDDIDNLYYNSNCSINRNAKSPFFYTHYNEPIFLKKKKNKTPNRNNEILRKQIDYRRMKFEKMREIEKKIKDYFITNEISLKNRELYHQSAIMIQSTFRSYLSRINLFKELNRFVATRLLFDLLNTFLSNKMIIYYDDFFNNIKNFKKYNKLIFMGNDNYQNVINNRNVISKKRNILNKNYKKDTLKIELSSYLNIISNNKYNKFNKNQNLILLNEKISNEKNYLEEELKKLKKENENLQNEIYKLKENQFSCHNSLANNKIAKTDIHKNDENIENVSLELKEIKIKKKKLDGLNIPILNLKKNINVNINEKFWKKNDNNKYKNLLLKYIVFKKIMKQKEFQRKVFYRYIINSHKMLYVEDNEKKDKLFKINGLKNVLEIINNDFRKMIYEPFFKIFYKSLYLKELNQKPLLYISKTKMKNMNIINRENSLRFKLKKIIQNKINKQYNVLQKIFIKFYYQCLLNRNNSNNNYFIINKRNENLFGLCNQNKIDQINQLGKLVNNKNKKNKELLKLLFHKFYYKGIISSIKINNQKSNENKNIYIKKGFENKKIKSK